MITEKGKSCSEKRKSLPKLTWILHGLLELGTYFNLTVLLILISAVGHSPEVKIKHCSSVIRENFLFSTWFAWHEVAQVSLEKFHIVSCEHSPHPGGQRKHREPTERLTPEDHSGVGG